MSYAIDTLQKELNYITEALKDFKGWENHPEAFKRQEKRKRELKKAIQDLNNASTTISSSRTE